MCSACETIAERLDRQDAERLAREAAQAATTFTLTYSKVERGLTAGGLNGPDLPCAYPDSPDHDAATCRAFGGWSGCFEGDSEKPSEWIGFWLACAVSEAVHEALEHFHVDGKPLLDPHGDAEVGVWNATAELAEKLIEMAAADPRYTKWDAISCRVGDPQPSEV